MKSCTKCQIPKPETDFFIRSQKTGRLHAQCKDCYTEQRKKTYTAHYQKYRSHYLARAKLRRKALRSALQHLILAYLSNKSCQVCHEADPRVLEFDHLDPSTKSFSISAGLRHGYKWSILLGEIEKCRILCANCHKRHTAMQNSWYKNI